MKVADKSDIGKKREKNEDNYCTDTERGIFLLADGMGGHQGGEIASDLAVREAYVHLKDGIDNTNGEKDFSKLLAEAMYRAHDAILEKAKSDIDLSGMGTTLIEMIIKDDTAYICHAGDSRVYFLHEDIEQITKDQTVGDFLVEHNIMSREQIHPQKWHSLTQAVGGSESLVPELYQKRVEKDKIELVKFSSIGWSTNTSPALR